MHFRRRAPQPPTPDPALPRSFEARYGRGVSRGVSLGGGGTFFVAWQVGYLKTLFDHDIRIGEAERLVGTSAGSIVATTLAHHHLDRLYDESALMSRMPGVMGKLFPSRVDTPSQEQTLDLYLNATDSTRDTVRSIGHAALAAVTPGPEIMPRDLIMVLGEDWGSGALWMTCVDAWTGDRCVMTRSSGLPVNLGAATSSAVPGIFPPQVVSGRKCMDGGVGGTAVHLDLLAGADKALVLSLYRDSDLTHGMLTLAPGNLDHELAELKAAGTEVFFRAPESHPKDIDGLMNPAGTPDAMAMGVRQATEDLEAGDLAAFWA